MPRFYCPQPLAVGLTIDLPDTVAHHAHVLRLQAGAELCLFNGDGADYSAQLVAVDKRRASARIAARSVRDAELPYAITLAQALPEGSKMDWIIEKAVEMGVAAIAPLAAQRCVVRLSGERAEKKAAHWQGVIVAASEQCGRNRLARLGALEDFSGWIARHRAPGTEVDHTAPITRLLLSPRGTQTLADWARQQPPQAISLLIGPEGGFTAQEEEAALAAGALALTMGPRVLRTETAGIAAVAMLQGLWGA